MSAASVTSSLLSQTTLSTPTAPKGTRPCATRIRDGCLTCRRRKKCEEQRCPSIDARLRWRRAIPNHKRFLRPPTTKLIPMVASLQTPAYSLPLLFHPAGGYGSPLLRTPLTTPTLPLVRTPAGPAGRATTRGIIMSHYSVLEPLPGSSTSVLTPTCRTIADCFYQAGLSARRAKRASNMDRRQILCMHHRAGY